MSEKREAILNAALGLVSERGFHDAPMSVIAEMANVGPGTIYRNFTNKQALIDALYQEIQRRVSTPMLEGFSEGRTPEERFKRIWRRGFQYCLNNPEEMRFLEQYHTSPFWNAENAAATRQHIQPIVHAFEKAAQAGELKPMPYEMVWLFVWNAIAAHADLHLQGILIVDEERLSLAIQACWDAVRAS